MFLDLKFENKYIIKARLEELHIKMFINDKVPDQIATCFRRWHMGFGTTTSTQESKNDPMTYWLPVEDE